MMLQKFTAALAAANVCMYVSKCAFTHLRQKAEVNLLCRIRTCSFNTTVNTPRRCSTRLTSKNTRIILNISQKSTIHAIVTLYWTIRRIITNDEKLLKMAKNWKSIANQCLQSTNAKCLSSPLITKQVVSVYRPWKTTKPLGFPVVLWHYRLSGRKDIQLIKTCFPCRTICSNC